MEEIADAKGENKVIGEIWWIYPLLSLVSLAVIVASYEWDNKRLREENNRLKAERKKFYEMFCKKR